VPPFFTKTHWSLSTKLPYALVASINLTRQRRAGHVAVKRIREINENFAVEKSVIYPSAKPSKGLELGETNNGCYRNRP